MLSQTDIESLNSNINLIKNFIYPDYPDLNIYSKQYYRVILSNLFCDAHISGDYAYTFIDINKLSVINEKYGFEKGDELLYETLKQIKSASSKNSIIARLGGDEFCVITPNGNVEEINEKYKLANDTIKQNPNNLDISFSHYTVSSKDSSNINKLFNIAESHVSKEKALRDASLSITTQENDDLSIPENLSDDEQNSWKTLNTKILNSVKGHLRDLRPSENFRFNIKDTKGEAFAVISALNDLIELKINHKKSISLSVNENATFSPKTAKQIHSLLTRSTDIIKDLSDEEIYDLQHSISYLKDILVRDPHSGLLSKSYFKSYLANELLNSENSYQTLYLSTYGIRTSNTAYGHEFSDLRLENTSSNIISSFSKKISFKNKPFSFDNQDNYFIDMGGGNFLSFISRKNALSDKEVQEMSDEINSSYDTNNMNSTFPVSIVYQNNISSETIQVLLDKEDSNFIDYSKYIENQCNLEKDILKHDSIISVDYISSLRKILSDCARYYVEEIPNPESITSKRIFSHNTFTSILMEEINHNKTMDEKQQSSSLNQKNSLQTIENKNIFSRLFAKLSRTYHSMHNLIKNFHYFSFKYNPVSNKKTQPIVGILSDKERFKKETIINEEIRDKVNNYKPTTDTYPKNKKDINKNGIEH